MERAALIVERQSDAYRPQRGQLDSDLPLESRIIKVVNAYDDFVGACSRATASCRPSSASSSLSTGDYDPAVVDVLAASSSARPSTRTAGRRTAATAPRGPPCASATLLTCQDGLSRHELEEEATEVCAEMVANVVTFVAAGDSVAAGDTLLILESMKMDPRGRGRRHGRRDQGHRGRRRPGGRRPVVLRLTRPGGLQPAGERVTVNLAGGSSGVPGRPIPLV